MRLNLSVQQVPYVLYGHVLLLIAPPGREPSAVSMTPSGGLQIGPLAVVPDHQRMQSLDADPRWQILLPDREVIWRLQHLPQRPYDLFHWNCEHVVSWLIGQPVTSPQIDRLYVPLGGAAVLGLAYLASGTLAAQGAARLVPGRRGTRRVGTRW